MQTLQNLMSAMATGYGAGNLIPLPPAMAAYPMQPGAPAPGVAPPAITGPVGGHGAGAGPGPVGGPGAGASVPPGMVFVPGPGMAPHPGAGVGPGAGAGPGPVGGPGAWAGLPPGLVYVPGPGMALPPGGGAGPGAGAVPGMYHPYGLLPVAGAVPGASGAPGAVAGPPPGLAGVTGAGMAPPPGVGHPPISGDTIDTRKKYDVSKPDEARTLKMFFVEMLSIPSASSWSTLKFLTETDGGYLHMFRPRVLEYGQSNVTGAQVDAYIALLGKFERQVVQGMNFNPYAPDDSMYYRKGSEAIPTLDYVQDYFQTDAMRQAALHRYGLDVLDDDDQGPKFMSKAYIRGFTGYVELIARARLCPNRVMCVDGYSLLNQALISMENFYGRPSDLLDQRNHMSWAQGLDFFLVNRLLLFVF